MIYLIGRCDILVNRNAHLEINSPFPCLTYVSVTDMEIGEGAANPNRKWKSHLEMEIEIANPNQKSKSEIKS